MEQMPVKLLSKMKRNNWEAMRKLLKESATGVDQISCDEAIVQNVPADIFSRLLSLNPHSINIAASDGRTALHIAVEYKRWQLVPILLNHGADVDMFDAWNPTPLHMAVNRDAPANIITQLISANNINLQDNHGNTVLHIVIQNERWQLVPIFLQRGADVVIRNNIKKTPLHEFTVRLGEPCTDILPQLITPNNVNVQDQDGRTALHGEIKNAQWELVLVLLQHGADVNVRSKWEMTALHYATCYDAPDHIITELASPTNINMQDADGDTALHMAVKKKWGIVPAIIQEGADIDICNKHMKAPLFYAVYYDAPDEIVSQLVSAKNVNMVDKQGNTALHLAVQITRWRLVSTLLQYGADANAPDLGNTTPLHNAIHHAPADTISQLITAQNINMQDLYGDTPLYCTLSIKRWDLVPVLIQHGADPSMLCLLPEQPRLHSLKHLCIGIVRRHMAVKSDEAFAGLGLPGTVQKDVKLIRQAEEVMERWRARIGG